MIIHVVQPGDTIQSIANQYETSVSILIGDNLLSEPQNLVIGQCIVIAQPELIYIVQEDDTLSNIANSHNVTIMQLLQNNPFLSDRAYIYPGDRIVISYNKVGRIATHGNALPYINNETYRKTLPYLTYLSIVNYTATDTGEIISYYDDIELIQIAKDYHVLPFLFLTTLTIKGEANIRTAYELLLSEDIQDRLMENILLILREKGFAGLNLSIEYVSEANLPYIEKVSARIAERLGEEGFLAFVTINPNITLVDDELVFQRVDYTTLGNMADSIIFMNYEWAMNLNPPSPVSSIFQIDNYLQYLRGTIPSDKLSIGLATIGYDWELPFIAGLSSVRILTYDSAVALARNEGVVIQFDNRSKTPYYFYTSRVTPYPVEHLVWFVDARSIDALLDLVVEYDLQGTGIWNITVYNAQLWLIINSQFEIAKFEVD
ncbi:MAG: LysM peptidoglycan-binding domain-containing protein [Clostridiales bacterium]|nr:LysM peptidoglycan-binding domain-containing protein [Clostridiales bacterium]